MPKDKDDVPEQDSTDNVVDLPVAPLVEDEKTRQLRGIVERLETDEKRGEALGNAFGRFSKALHHAIFHEDRKNLIPDEKFETPTRENWGTIRVNINESDEVIGRFLEEHLPTARKIKEEILAESEALHQSLDQEFRKTDKPFRFQSSRVTLSGVKPGERPLPTPDEVFSCLRNFATALRNSNFKTPEGVIWYLGLDDHYEFGRAADDQFGVSLDLHETNPLKHMQVISGLMENPSKEGLAGLLSLNKEGKREEGEREFRVLGFPGSTSSPVLEEENPEITNEEWLEQLMVRDYEQACLTLQPLLDSPVEGDAKLPSQNEVMEALNQHINPESVGFLRERDPESFRLVLVPKVSFQRLRNLFPESAPPTVIGNTAKAVKKQFPQEDVIQGYEWAIVQSEGYFLEDEEKERKPVAERVQEVQASRPQGVSGMACDAYTVLFADSLRRGEPFEFKPGNGVRGSVDQYKKTQSTILDENIEDQTYLLGFPELDHHGLFFTGPLFTGSVKEGSRLRYSVRGKIGGR